MSKASLQPQEENSLVPYISSPGSVKNGLVFFVCVFDLEESQRIREKNVFIEEMDTESELMIVDKIFQDI